MRDYNFINMVGNFKDDLETYVEQLKKKGGPSEEIKQCEEEIQRLKDLISEEFNRK